MSGEGIWTDEAARRQALSDLMDGEVDEAAVTQACQAWRASASLRGEWHAYHVIGDVLRTPDLSSRGGVRDAAFLDGVRRRLAAEPVVVAPSAASASSARPLDAAFARDDAPSDAPSSRSASSMFAPLPAGTGAAGGAAVAVTGAARRARWRAPAAVAAGFMAVAGVLVVTRVNQPTTDAVLANAPAPAVKTVAPSATTPSAVAVGLSPQSVSQPTLVISDQRMLRDAQLDRYLQAHRQGGLGAVADAPGGVVRSVSTLAPDR